MKITGFIDHTLLKPEATPDQIKKLCEEAAEHHFASVCVNSSHVPLAAKMLRGTGVKVCAVVGFPLGAMSTRGKVAEASHALHDGACEIDMVISVGHLKGGDLDYVRNDIAEVVSEVHHESGIVKVIIETSLLNDDQKRTACELAVAAGADFVKTSTGFSGGGATVADVRLMKSVVGDKAKVKASGGIRTHEDAVQMIEAGANRLGIGQAGSLAVVSGMKSEAAY